MLLYIIRHGDPDYENDCLTKKGKKQADGYTVPKCLCLFDISHVYKEDLPLEYHNILNI